MATLKPHEDPAKIAATGYNEEGAKRYLEWANSHPTVPQLRMRMLDRLYTHLREQGEIAEARVLELGCGAGDPVTIDLARKCGKVLANDVSSTQIQMLKERLEAEGEDLKGKVEPAEGDMMKLAFEDGSFDAVVAFYSIIHLRREDQITMIKDIHRWLKPAAGPNAGESGGGGYFLCCFAAQEAEANVNENWLGMRAFWSGWGKEASLKMVQEAGFEMLMSEVVESEGDAEFCWVIARKA